MKIIFDNYQPKRDVEHELKIKRFEEMLEQCVKTLENVLRSPFPSTELMNKIWELVVKVEKFLFREQNKN